MKYYVDVNGKYVGGTDGAPLSEFEVSHAPDDARQPWNGDGYDDFIDPNEFRHLREAEYPDVGDVIDAICKYIETGDKTEFDIQQEKRNTVKAKHPK